ncbi:MAG: terpene cyclase/mutase family protein, partial [Planctomycetes bacterium]|nr:terpene cyclase/mutase family protein [Planctomycetota bacterium]
TPQTAWEARLRKPVSALSQQASLFPVIRIQEPDDEAVRADGSPLWYPAFKRDLSSWCFSAAIHMALMVILGLLIIEATQDAPLTLIAIADNPWHDTRTREPVERFEPDVVATPLTPRESCPASELLEPKSEAAPFAATETMQLSVAINLPNHAVDSLGPTSTRSASGQPSSGAGSVVSMFAWRDPRLRGQILEREGGTKATEDAVARGLKWIAHHQNPDGSWSLEAFDAAGDCNGQCRHLGHTSQGSAGTALSLLAFLGAGNTHIQGNYQKNVAMGLHWLMEHQGADGDLRVNGARGMYDHGQATMVLCEALALSRDKTLRASAQRAVDFIVKAQHPAGGWRYAPGQPGDTSVLGWQLMALRSARAAGLEVPNETFSNAIRYLESVQPDRYAGLFSYLPGEKPGTPAITAEGLLSEMYAGWRGDNRSLQAGIAWLRTKHPPDPRESEMYYWYYGTQVMHHYGGREWQDWNFKMRELLIRTQETRGHELGSWTPHSSFDFAGGRLYTTALAVCILEVYYRHEPLIRPPLQPQAVLAK